MPTTAVPRPTSTSSELPFKYVGGDPSLDLVNTVDWLGDALDHDRIPDYDRLTRWAEGAAVITRAVGDRLRRRAADRPREATTAVVAAARLRWVLQRVFASVAGGRPDDGALAELNDLLADALSHLELGASTARVRRVALVWRGLSDELASPLWPVTWSAAQLLASDEAVQINVCAAPNCGWMYVDRSRNGLRRWCQMETCGTRAKNRRRRS